MNTKLTIFLFFISVQYSIAQTIPVTALFTVGDSAMSQRISTLEVIDPGEATIGAVWDFSDVEIIDSLVTPFTVKYVDPMIWGTNDFTEEGVIGGLTTGTNEYLNFYNELGGQIYDAGGINSGGTITKYLPPVYWFNFPFSYGETLSSEGEIELAAADGSFVITNDITVERTFDGVGTLITSAGTFEDCLRIKHSYEAVAGPNFVIESETYYYYYNKLSNEMAKLVIQENGGDTTYNFTWQNNVNDIVSTTQEVELVKPEVRYSNNGNFLIKDIDGTFHLSLYQINGKEVCSKEILLISSGTEVHFDVDDLAPQVCLLLLMNEETGVFFTHRFFKK